MAAQESSERPEGIPGEALTGLSAFVARVLNQLSLSAWLPSAFLTVTGAFLLQFRLQHSLNLANAAASLTKHPATALILAVPVLVSTTLVTQAFSFEAIRVLEGYWHRPGIPILARNLMIRWHVYRKAWLETRRMKAREKAFTHARSRLIGKIPDPVLCALEKDAHEIKRPPLTGEYSRYQKMEWRSKCNAWELARVDHLFSAVGEYPLKRSRILPTRLGNLMRATEDRLKNAGQDLEGFVLQRRNLVSDRVQQQHDQFRSRLEMYCILVFVSGVLSVLAPALLLGQPINTWEILFLAGGFTAVGFASYQAAIASARGYCAALKQMDKPSIS
jgi:hypothetical protein